jgi:hypothetical protein
VPGWHQVAAGEWAAGGGMAGRGKQVIACWGLLACRPGGAGGDRGPGGALFAHAFYCGKGKDRHQARAG